MAKAKAKQFKAKALLNLTYNLKPYNVDETLKVNELDVAEMVERGYIEMLEEVEADVEIIEESEGTKGGE